MTYLIITNDDTAVNEIKNMFDDNNMNAIYDKRDEYTIEDIQNNNAIVIDTNDIKTIIDMCPLESFHIVSVSTKQHPKNDFEQALVDKSITLPISKNCSAVHMYNPSINKTSIKDFAEFLVGYRNEFNTVKHMIQDGVKNNRIKKGAYENTVLVYDKNKQAHTISSDIFTDSAMSDDNTYRTIVSAYFAQNPIV